MVNFTPNAGNTLKENDFIGNSSLLRHIVGGNGKKEDDN